MSRGLKKRLVAMALIAVSAPCVPRPLVDLGQALFFDKRLSADGSTSCSSCHDPAKAFQDGRRTAVGVGGQVGTRNTPSLLGVGAQGELFWDGRRESLEAQAADPLTNPREHGLPDIDDALARLESAPAYRVAFAQANVAIGRRPSRVVNAPTLVEALAAYERTLVDGESPFERFRFDGDESAIPPQAKRGWALFSGTAKCTACHEVGDRKPARFTDLGYHAVGASASHRPVGQALGELVQRFLRERAAGASIDRLLLSDAQVSELGRFVVTQSPADIGKFKTPSLRNVALTAPYMHDGSVASLAEAVDLEASYRGAEDGHPLILTNDEKTDIVAFLHTLTGNRAKP